ncbi:MAG: hypothetical protein GXP31_18605 [Kiritimatiellaeota bacterium]|nr:hypothetical protein [Kiritimatiellota bacterium]
MSIWSDLPPDTDQDIAEHRRDVQRFLDGDLAPGFFKAKRVPRGIYEQRREGTYMVRVRIAGGVLAPRQARCLATVSRELGSGRLHLTTRQDIQIHDVRIGDTPEVLSRLRKANLSPRGGGGNTVRNVAACPYAGICPEERFDVTPWAHAVTTFLLRLPGSFHLPRKYKISFSGCDADCALTGVQDLGFVAVVRDGVPGFAVYAGGGMGAAPRVGELLYDFVPAPQSVPIAEAVRRVFDRIGDRKDRSRARLRFAVERIGMSSFRQAVDRALASTGPAYDGLPDLGGVEIFDGADPDAGGVCAESGPGLCRDASGFGWLEQRQPGYVALVVSLPLGELHADTLEAVGDVAESMSDETELRTTRNQDLLIRFVPTARKSAVVRALREIGLGGGDDGPAPLEAFTACAGADTCKLGLCLSRPLCRACATAMGQAGLHEDVLDAVDIRVSGCPNSCGQHPVGDIGLFGSARRVAGRLVPRYNVLAGARRGAGRTRFGTLLGGVPARVVPDLLVEMVRQFARDRRPGETYAEYVERLGVESLRKLVLRHDRTPEYDAAPDFYRDWGDEAEFSLAGRGPGECGAGVVEVIQEGLREAVRLLENPSGAEEGGAPLQALLAACGALLITRGMDSADPDAILHGFEVHFLDPGLVDSSFRDLFARARGQVHGWTAALANAETEIARLLEELEVLFGTMDSDLNFHPPKSGAGPATETSESAEASTQERESAGTGGEEGETVLDLKGVPCPLNFVRAKLQMEELPPSAILAIILDEGEPIRNVPVSFRSEGYQVLEMNDLGDGHWEVKVRNRPS